MILNILTPIDHRMGFHHCSSSFFQKHQRKRVRTGNFEMSSEAVVDQDNPKGTIKEMYDFD